MSEAEPPPPDDAAASWHVSAELCRRFLEGRVSPPERRAVVRHLITECSECIALMGRISAESGYWLGKAGADAFVDRDYAEAFQAAFRFASQAARRVALERLHGWAHWSALDPLLPDERLPTIIERKDWHHWGLFWALLDAAHWYRTRDPEEAADIARLALEVARLLNPFEVGSEAAAWDLRAGAWVVLADCLRRAGDLAGARRAIAEAWRWNEEGAGDPLDKARIYIADASYAAAIGELDIAAVVLEKAVSLYRAAGETHLHGRTLVTMARTIGYADPDRGIAHLEAALELLNPVRAPRLEICAQHLLAEFLCAAGRPEEALAILDRVRPLYREFPDEEAQLRLHWLQGRVSLALGEAADAVAVLRQAQEEFRARDFRQDFILVSIDLAEAHVAQGETATALRVLTEVTPLLASWNPHRDLLDTWLRFQEELQDETLTAPGIFKRFRLYYRRHWHVPAAEFSPD
jgi:tetratricopeptide (TPR) repeat protein